MNNPEEKKLEENIKKIIEYEPKKKRIKEYILTQEEISKKYFTVLTKKYNIIYCAYNYFVFYLIYYPFYRHFLHIKINTFISLNNRREIRFKDFRYMPRIEAHLGMRTFLISRLIPFIIPEFLRLKNNNYFIMSIFCQGLGYPLLVYSNLKAIKYEKFSLIKNFAGLYNIYGDRRMFKGFFLQMLNFWLIYLPFFNYLCHPIESIRILYSIGNFRNKDFKNYKEAYNFLKENNGLKSGRLYYNMPIHIYNLYIIFFYNKTK